MLGTLYIICIYIYIIVYTYIIYIYIYVYIHIIYSLIIKDLQSPVHSQLRELRLEAPVRAPPAETVIPSRRVAGDARRFKKAVTQRWVVMNGVCFFRENMT